MMKRIQCTAKIQIIIPGLLNNMKLMHKKQLIEENTKLKNTIKNLEDQVERLKTKINDLTAANAFGRRGMPWR